MVINNKISNEVNVLLNKGNYNAARDIVEKELQKITVNSNILWTAELYGLLIDIGCESNTENDLNQAIDFMLKSEQKLGIHVKKASFYYNLANAKHGLSTIFLSKNHGVQNLENIKVNLQEPINYYWLAYKHLDSKNQKDLKFQILINLSNCLLDVGRLVEAINFLDLVLRNKPDYPQALMARGNTLNLISTVTNSSLTVNLFIQMYKAIDDAIKTNLLPEPFKRNAINKRASVLSKIQSYGFDIDDINKEISESLKESLSHSRARKFAIENFLTLNEHALYCNCNVSGKDDLQLGVSFAILKGEIIGKQELLLNRLKSEFALARHLFYQSRNKSKIDFDSGFSELLDGEIITPKTEMLRSSFRLSYGILDKIALGICKLYDLSKVDDSILFEAFWKKDNKRWEKLNGLKNYHLSALYSIACDLNSKTGELKQFKEWRNKLEHKVLVLHNNKVNQIDVLKLYEDADFVAITDLKDFEDKTLHLLQLTRAAIFSFVYCVRLQTISEDTGEGSAFFVNFKEG
jgi:tetratricopeptide (TPR) repeat protein